MESSEFKIIYELKNLQKNENIVKIIQGFDENENEIEVSFNGAIAVGLNIVLNLILVKFMAHSGLALATSIATTISTLLLHGLKKKIGSLGTKIYITTLLKTGLASGVMGLKKLEISSLMLR